MAVDVEISGLVAATRRMSTIERRMENIEKALKPAAAKLDTLIQTSFEKAEDPWNDQWKPLSEATKERRRQARPTPLVDTGELRKSTNAEVQGQTILMGTSPSRAAIGRFHQFGLGSPARPFLPVDPDTRRPRFDRGRAERWWNRTKMRIRNYIIHGRPSPNVIVGRR